jgi:hypothetical protein
MIAQDTLNLSLSHMKTKFDKVQNSENLNFLWEIALELNNNKALSNAKLQVISNHLYHLKKRTNKKKLDAVKEVLITAIQRLN